MDFEEFIEEFGIDKMSPEVQKSIFESVFESLSIRVAERLAEDMTKEEFEQFQATLRQGGDKALAAELEQRHPDLSRIFQEELWAIKQDAKAIMPKQD